MNNGNDNGGSSGSKVGVYSELTMMAGLTCTTSIDESHPRPP